MHVTSQAIVNKRDCACITLVHYLLEQCTNVSFLLWLFKA